MKNIINQREEENMKRINQELGSQISDKAYQLLKIQESDLQRVYDLDQDLTDQDIIDWVKEHLIYHSN
jgi:hypothetical protein